MKRVKWGYILKQTLSWSGQAILLLVIVLCYLLLPAQIRAIVVAAGMLLFAAIGIVLIFVIPLLAIATISKREKQKRHAHRTQENA